MAQEPNPVEQAVARAVRDNLDRLKQTVEELDQAYADLVSACSSTRPTNTLPPMLRAQSAAASLAAMLEVLARFITNSLHVPRSAAEQAVMQAVSVAIPPPPPAEPVMPPPRIPTPMAVEEEPAPMAAARAPEPVVEAPPPPPPPPVVEEPAPAARLEETVEMEVVPPAPPEPAPAPEPTVEAPPAPAVFDIASLSPDEQKLHARADRAAKVSMQDIKLYKKQEVKLGIENKDVCVRLREDIDKAKKEYDRRFRSILDHPVDYFYKWMVEILGEGDPEALGEYPYSSSVHRR
jgi:uncharacterized damage-inducible protein DinB